MVMLVHYAIREADVSDADLRATLEAVAAAIERPTGADA
jgi:hypothetical protein